MDAFGFACGDVDEQAEPDKGIDRAWPDGWSFDPADD
jgi:hypothetical protein